MSTALHTQLVSDDEWDILREMAGISPRQTDILKCIMQGESDKQIAEELGISLPTVRTHIERLFHKFDLNDRVELLIYFFVLLRETWDNRPSEEDPVNRAPADVRSTSHEPAEP